jgi:hypothetical protein
MVSSVSVSTEFDAPPSATDESGEMESSGDCDDDDRIAS